jgi:hypothetical protein
VSGRAHGNGFHCCDMMYSFVCDVIGEWQEFMAMAFIVATHCTVSTGKEADSHEAGYCSHAHSRHLSKCA